MIDVDGSQLSGIEPPVLPLITFEPPESPVIVTIAAEGPKGQDGADLSPDDLLALTIDVQESVTESLYDELNPATDLVLLFENGLA